MAQFNFPGETVGYSLIRFSSRKQADGTSFERQLNLATGFCADEQVIHDNSLHETDTRKLGMSAFSGSHVIKGPIRKFLNGVEEGTVKRGSLLLVGEWSRLTRQVSSDAVKLVIDIMERGIGIVDLQDSTLYTLDRYNGDIGLQLGLQLKISIAHQYSQNLRHNLTHAWEIRRQKIRAGQGKATNACPGWLRAVDECFVEIPERCEIVRQIFEYAVSGMGKRAIARLLNEKEIPAFRGQNGWHSSSVGKIIAAQSVIGIYQPCIRHQPIGEPILGYYPAIIPEVTFWKAHGAREANKPANGGYPSGRKGAGYPNLIMGLAKCAECGGGLVYVDKGSAKRAKGTSGGAFLVCANLKRKLCTNRYHRSYPALERDLLAILTLFDYETLLAKAAPANEVEQIEAEIASRNAILEKIASRFTGDEPDAVIERMKRLQVEVRELTVKLAEARRAARIAEATAGEDAFREFIWLVSTLSSRA